jgi:hypothetical protein
MGDEPELSIRRERLINAIEAFIDTTGIPPERYDAFCLLILEFFLVLEEPNAKRKRRT